LTQDVAMNAKKRKIFFIKFFLEVVFEIDGGRLRGTRFRRFLPKFI